MTIKLVTDSTCDLPESLLKQCHIHVVPINIQFGTESFKENVTITPHYFYQKIDQEGIFPKTSQPSVGEFVEMYRSLADQTNEIISIHVTAKLSGTCQSAKLAASMIDGPVKISVIDSGAGSSGLGWMLLEAAEMIAAGESTATIKQHLEQKRNDISLYFAVDNLKFAQMSGRVGKLRGMLGTLLNIKPIIGLNQGIIEVQEQVRSNKAALRRMVAVTKQKVQDQAVNVAVVHALAPERAEQLLTMTKESLNVRDSFIENVAISLAVHFGPGTLGLIAYPVR